MMAAQSSPAMFRSPTCTFLDKAAAEALADIAGISIPEFASEMFRAGSNLKDKSPEEIFYQDFKKFIMGDVTFGVGQITSLDAVFSALAFHLRQKGVVSRKKQLIPAFMMALQNQ